MFHVLFAEAPPAEYLGYFLLAVLAILQGVSAFRQLFDRPSDKEFVMRKDFDEVRRKLDIVTSQISTFVTRQEMELLKQQLHSQYLTMERDTRRRFAQLTKKLEETKLSVEVLHRDIVREMSSMMTEIRDRMDRYALAEAKSNPEVKPAAS